MREDRNLNHDSPNKREILSFTIQTQSQVQAQI